MPRQSVQEQLAALEKKEAKLAAKRAELRAKVRADERKNDARKFRLVGAAAIAEATRNPEFAKVLLPLVKSTAKSDMDKEALAALLAQWKESDRATA